MSNPVPESPARPRRLRRRLIAAGAGAVIVAGLAAAGIAARWYVHTGDQPAEALPASTLAYVAVDLDPSGREKLAAHGVLDKLPVSRTEDLGSVSDLPDRILKSILGSGGCGDVDYDKDVAPWLGKRAAAALVDLKRAGVTPAVVLQSTDDDKADLGMRNLLENCTGPDVGAWDVHDGWIVWAPSQENADAVVAATRDGSLADSSAYQDLTDKAGGPGLVNAYMAKSSLGKLLHGFAPSTLLSPAMLDRLAQHFPAMALSVRAQDGQIRADIVGVLSGARPGKGSEATSIEPDLAGLPADSSAVVAMHASGGGSGDDAFSSMFKSQLGARIGDPVLLKRVEQYYRRLLGAPIEQVVSDVLDSSLVAVLGPTTSTDAGLPPTELPLAGRVTPAADKRDAVLGYFRKLSRNFPVARWATASDSSIVVGTSAKAREELTNGHGLTDSDRFASVVDLDGHDVVEAAYVDLRSGLISGLLDQIGAEDPDTVANLRKLTAVGLAGWAEDGTTHVELRIGLD